MTQFDINTGLRDAGVTDFSLGWDDAPFNMALDSLDGNLNFDLDDGYLKEFNDQGSQVSRVLGLLSLKSLLRKLRFLISATYSTAVSSLKTYPVHLYLNDGVASTSDFFIDGQAFRFFNEW